MAARIKSLKKSVSPKIKIAKKKNGINNQSKTKMDFSNSIAVIDLHGYYIEDALLELDKFLNAAVLNKIEEARIIHGKGTGKLKTAIEKHLKNTGLIKEFVAPFFLKNAGETIVKLIRI